MFDENWNQNLTFRDFAFSHDVSVYAIALLSFYWMIDFIVVHHLLFWVFQHLIWIEHSIYCNDSLSLFVKQFNTEGVQFAWTWSFFDPIIFINTAQVQFAWIRYFIRPVLLLISTVGITLSGNIKVMAGQAQDELSIRVYNKLLDNDNENQHFIQSRPAGTNRVSYSSSNMNGTQVFLIIQITSHIHGLCYF